MATAIKYTNFTGNNLPKLDLIQRGFSFGKYMDDAVTIPDML